MGATTVKHSQMLEEYRIAAEAGGNFHGLSIVKFTRSIKKQIDRFDAKTLLDYGSGRGDAYGPPNNLAREFGVMPTLYDPAFDTHNRKPPHGQVFDGVICSDVLEHVHGDHVDEVIMELGGYARHFVWASVCCRPAKKFFSDGVTNMHCTIQPYEWWFEKFKRLIPLRVSFKLLESA